MTTGNSSRPQSAAILSPVSLPLFQEDSSINVPPGGLNDDLLVREVITESIKRSGKSREQIAEEMTRTLGIPVTARMITSFTSESKELHRWPGAWDRSFCMAVSDTRLLFCCVELAGFRVIDATEAELLDLGREYLRQKRSSEKVALLERRLQGVDL
jgi:hypothetical protein